MTTHPITNNKGYYILIGILSVAIPAAVAFMFYFPNALKLGNIDVSLLPHVNAVLNSFTAVVLIVGYYFIKKGNRRAHISSMVSAFVLSSLFLVSYVIYHSQGTHTVFGDINGDGLASEAEIAETGVMRGIYLFVLLTHIVLAAIIVPFVLLSIYLGWTNNYKVHRKISRYTFPMWLYVAVTGVIVYLMISPYYQ